MWESVMADLLRPFFATNAFHSVPADPVKEKAAKTEYYT